MVVVGVVDGIVDVQGVGCGTNDYFVACAVLEFGAVAFSSVERKRCHRCDSFLAVVGAVVGDGCMDAGGAFEGIDLERTDEHAQESCSEMCSDSSYFRPGGHNIVRMEKKERKGVGELRGEQEEEKEEITMRKEDTRVFPFTRI